MKAEKKPDPNPNLQREESVRIYGPERWQMSGEPAYPLTLVMRRYRRDEQGQELLVDSREYRRVDP
jgi:hypothetical protein